MINLKDITEKNLLSIIYLTPADNQKDQVAPNSVSIAQGLFSKTAWFKGVFYNDIPVGFVMLDLNKKEKKCRLWRFMIDKKYQGKGYGKITLIQVINWVKSQELFDEFYTSFVPKKNGAEGFYKKLGFVESSEFIDPKMVSMKYSLS